MKFSSWENKYKQLKSSNLLMLLSNLILGVLLTISLYLHLVTKPIVVVQPMVAPQALDIKANTLTKSYATSFGISMALLLGNVTSTNMSFVLESVANYVSPSYFATFRKQLVADMTKLQENKMDMSFIVTNAKYDPATNEVVIDGVASIVDIAGSRISNPHQYRLQLEMTNYVPQIIKITSIDLAN